MQLPEWFHLFLLWIGLSCCHLLSVPSTFEENSFHSNSYVMVHGLLPSSNAVTEKTQLKIEKISYDHHQLLSVLCLLLSLPCSRLLAPFKITFLSNSTPKDQKYNTDHKIPFTCFFTDPQNIFCLYVFSNKSWYKVFRCKTQLFPW